MILYLDTSALVKLYVQEIGSADVKDWLQDADAAATSRRFISPRPSGFVTR